MGDDQPLREVARFGVFELDLRAGELRKQGMRVRLQEQPFLVLAQLVKRPGELLSREELQKELWPGESFGDFEHGLNKAVNKIREALGDSAESPRFVETIARRGYRFLPEVKITAAPGRGQSEVVTQFQAGAGFDDQRTPASATLVPAKTFRSARVEIADGGTAPGGCGASRVEATFGNARAQRHSLTRGPSP